MRLLSSHGRHGDHVAGLEVLCVNFAIPQNFFANVVRQPRQSRPHGEKESRCYRVLGEHKNWRKFLSDAGTTSLSCIFWSQIFRRSTRCGPVGPTLSTPGKRYAGLVFHHYEPSDTHQMFDRLLLEVHTLRFMTKTTTSEKLLQNDPHRPWPVEWQRNHVAPRPAFQRGSGQRESIQAGCRGKMERVLCVAGVRPFRASCKDNPSFLTSGVATTVGEARPGRADLWKFFGAALPKRHQSAGLGTSAKRPRGDFPSRLLKSARCD